MQDKNKKIIFDKLASLDLRFHHLHSDFCKLHKRIYELGEFSPSEFIKKYNQDGSNIIAEEFGDKLMLTSIGEGAKFTAGVFKSQYNEDSNITLDITNNDIKLDIVTDDLSKLFNSKSEAIQGGNVSISVDSNLISITAPLPNSDNIIPLISDKSNVTATKNPQDGLITLIAKDTIPTTDNVIKLFDINTSNIDIKKTNNLISLNSVLNPQDMLELFNKQYDASDNGNVSVGIHEDKLSLLAETLDSRLTNIDIALSYNNSTYYINSSYEGTTITDGTFLFPFNNFNSINEIISKSDKPLTFYVSGDFNSEINIENKTEYNMTFIGKENNCIFTNGMDLKGTITLKYLNILNGVTISSANVIISNSVITGKNNGSAGISAGNDTIIKIKNCIISGGNNTDGDGGIGISMITADNSEIEDSIISGGNGSSASDNSGNGGNGINKVNVLTRCTVSGGKGGDSASGTGETGFAIQIISTSSVIINNILKGQVPTSNETYTKIALNTFYDIDDTSAKLFGNSNVGLK